MRTKRLLAVLLILALGFGAPAPTGADAHAVFISAEPAPGARLPRPPAAVRIVYSEPLNAPLSAIALYDSYGKSISATAAAVDSADARAYVIKLPPLAPDRYTVLWHTTSLVDGHTRQGSYTFTVLEANGATPAVGSVAIHPPSPFQMPDWANAFTKWLALFGLFLLTGPILLRLLVPEGAGESAFIRLSLRGLLAAGIVALVLGSLGQLLAVWLPAGSVGAIGSVLRGGFGRWWLVRMGAALLLALSGGSTAAAAGHSRWRAWLNFLLVGIIALSFAATSHGAASEYAGWGAAFDFVHVLAAGVWIGGLLAIAPLFLARRQAEAEQTDRRLMLRRFSIVAGMAVAAVLLSGLGSALIELGSIRDLVDRAYGVSLTIKLVAVGALLAVAAANAFLLRPAFESGRPIGERISRSIILEALLGLAVLVPAAAMSVQAPSRPQDQVQSVAARLAANEDPSRQFSGDTEVSGQAVEVTLTPAAVGINQLHVEIAGAVGIPRVNLTLLGPSGERTHATAPRTGLERQEDGRDHTVYEIPLRIDGAPGAWQGTVTLPSGAGSGSPLIVPIAPAAGGSDPPRAGPPAAWLVLVAAALATAVAAAATRALPPRRRGIALGGLATTGVFAALGVWIFLAATAQQAGTGSRQGAWGVSTPAPARTLAADAHLWTVPTPNSGLMPPAVGPDGSVWVSEMDTNKLAQLLPIENRVRELDFGKSYKGTMGIAVGSDNIVWLAQSSASAIGRFDPVSGGYMEFATPAKEADPTGVALDRAGIVWFTELAADKIGRFDPQSHTFLEFPIPTPNATPYWLAIAPDGRIWFSELAGAKIGVLDPASERVVEYSTPGQQRAGGVAVAADGTVWVGTLDGSVDRFAPQSGAFTQFKAPSGSIYGVTVASDGTVWAGTTGSVVYSLDPNSGAFSEHDLPANAGSWWPAAGAGGGVWVTLGGASVNALALLHATAPSGGVAG